MSEELAPRQFGDLGPGERTYKRVGGNTWKRTNFRLVCATNRNLHEEKSRGAFREDLYQRLRSWTCRLPPLAVLNDGTHVVVCPYDYVTNTQELADGVSAYRESKPGVTTVFITADRVSPAARKTLESANITVVEGGPSNL